LATWHGVVHDIVLYGILMLLFLGIRMFIYQNKYYRMFKYLAHVHSMESMHDVYGCCFL